MTPPLTHAPLKLKETVVAGFAMFAMFFGSGNLIFPLLIGKDATSAFPWAIVGFIVSGVCIPFLGLIGILLYQGSYLNFFARLGRIGAMVLSFFLLSLMGPFGVIPRCVTVAYGSFLTLFPATSLALFSFVMCMVIFLLSVRENKVVPFLGTFLAPAKFLSVGLIVVFGVLFAPESTPSTLTNFQALSSGLFQGYQTMDLIASFFFATVIMKYLMRFQTDDQPLMMRTALGAVLLGGGLMSLVYVGMVFLGATYAGDLMMAQPEQYLAIIAHVSLGALSGKIVTVAIILACLTTAIALATTFTDFVYEHLFQKRFSRTSFLAITLAISFGFSTFGFSGIAGYLGPILNTLYPLLILYTFYNIGVWMWKQKHSRL